MESLYLKYRPQTFDTMVGQQHIVTTLQNALEENRQAHAYVFIGPRGTGKTSTARILAKALLCDTGVTAHPDPDCPQCKQIAEGVHPDVYELDAASHTGVSNVREEIINRVALAPTQGRFRVYIIDEVHMLSTAAFNALLKTLEEPPAHVVFIMCTTDPQRIPETIMSRCQRLEFHRISQDDIARHLAKICDKEGFTAESGSLDLIARTSRGGMRDALSTLEQLSIYGSGNITLEDAQNLLGEATADAMADLVEKIARRDIPACFEAVARASSRGADAQQLASELTSYMRNVLIARMTGPGASAEVLDAGDPDTMTRLAGLFESGDRLLYILDVLGQLESTMRSALDPQLSLEVALARIARPDSDLTVEALSARIAVLEQALASGGFAAVQTASPACATPVSSAASAAGVPAASVPAVPPSTAVPAATAAATAANNAAPAPTPQASEPESPAPSTPEPAPAQSTPEPASVPQPAKAATPSQPATPWDGNELWGTLVNTVRNSDSALGAILQMMTGGIDSQDRLALTNHGSAFAQQMLKNPDIQAKLSSFIEAVYGRKLAFYLVGEKSPATPSPATPSPAVPATPSPAAPATPSPAQPAASISRASSQSTPSWKRPDAIPPSRPQPEANQTDSQSARAVQAAPAPAASAPQQAASVPAGIPVQQASPSSTDANGVQKVAWDSLFSGAVPGLGAQPPVDAGAAAAAAAASVPGTKEDLPWGEPPQTGASSAAEPAPGPGPAPEPASAVTAEAAPQAAEATAPETTPGQEDAGIPPLVYDIPEDLDALLRKGFGEPVFLHGSADPA